MSEAQKISGVVYKVLKEESGTGKKGAWVKKSFVIETKDQYPKKIMFTAWNDKCDLIPKPGTEVVVSYNPESREYNEKWYTDLNMWDLKVVGGQSATPSKPEKQAKVTAPVKSGLNLDEEDQDLPF